MPPSPAGSDTSEATAVEDDAPRSVRVSHEIGTDVIYFLLLPLKPFQVIISYFGHVTYLIYQTIVAFLFTPPRPDITKYEAGEKKFKGRIAVIGAGVSGVSSACHAIAHDYDVVLFDKHDRPGGIWLDENDTSGLQLNSILYRFFPSIIWQSTFPKKEEILDNVAKIWKHYDLESRSRFNYTVDKVHRYAALSTDPKKKGHGRWVINDGRDGVFDAVICTVGTVAAPKMLHLKGQDRFGGKVVHSSQLDALQDIPGKTVVIIGSGASAVEAAELAVRKKAKTVKVLAHSDKWIIPRNVAVDILLAFNPLGRSFFPLSNICEYLLRKLHYRDLEWLSPAPSPQAPGLFDGTPIVNDQFLNFVRQGKVMYLRGDILSMDSLGVVFHSRQRGESEPKDAGVKEKNSQVVEADIVIMATGYERPSVDFLPQDLFPTGDQGDYHIPNLYLQNFSVEDWSILLTNAAYKSAIGTVGNWHIGVYTRILLTFLMEKSTRPLPKDEKLWVDCIRFIKRNAPGGSLTFFS